MTDMEEYEPGDFVGYRLILRAAALSREFADVLRPHGLTAHQFSALAVLQGSPGLSNAELARSIAITPQSVGGLLDTLRSRGLVERSGNAGKGNIGALTLTNDGAARLGAAYGSVASLDVGVRAALGDSYSQLLAILSAWE